MKKKLLVVEDHNQIRRLIIDALKISDPEFEIAQAENGALGLEELKSDSPMPDLILLDRIMPELTGDELLVKIRNNDDWKDIPVMMNTAKSKCLDIVEALGSQLGADAYLVKPFNFEDMIKKVKELLHHSEKGSIAQYRQSNLDKAILAAMDDEETNLTDEKMDELANDQTLKTLLSIGEDYSLDDKEEEL